MASVVTATPSIILNTGGSFAIFIKNSTTNDAFISAIIMAAIIEKLPKRRVATVTVRPVSISKVSQIFIDVVIGDAWCVMLILL